DPDRRAELRRPSGSPCCRPRGTGPGAGGAYGCVGTVVGCAGFSEPKSGGRSWDPLLEPGSGPDPMEPSGPEGALDVSEVGADGLGGPDSSAPSVTVGTGTVVGGSDEPGGVGSVATGGVGWASPSVGSPGVVVWSPGVVVWSPGVVVSSVSVGVEAPVSDSGESVSEASGVGRASVPRGSCSALRSSFRSICASSSGPASVRGCAGVHCWDEVLVSVSEPRVGA